MRFWFSKQDVKDNRNDTLAQHIRDAAEELRDARLEWLVESAERNSDGCLDCEVGEPHACPELSGVEHYLQTIESFGPDAVLQARIDKLRAGDSE